MSCIFNTFFHFYHFLYLFEGYYEWLFTCNHLFTYIYEKNGEKYFFRKIFLFFQHDKKPKSCWSAPKKLDFFWDDLSRLFLINKTKCMNNPLGGSRQNFWRVFSWIYYYNFQINLLAKHYKKSLNDTFYSLQDLAHPV